MRKVLISILSVIFASALLVGCSSLDVILRDSPKSLERILAANPALVTAPAGDSSYFSFSTDGETALLVSRDYSLSAEDLLLRTPLSPFTDAGLDVSKLGAGYRADERSLYLAADFGNGTGSKGTFTDALFESVKADRSALGYHAALDHYGIALTNGKFEWAKDAASNDKDVVFVLFAKPLADLGVDVQNIEGWKFMTMQDEAGNDLDVLVKPYSLN
jgi:hypothetical protein